MPLFADVALPVPLDATFTYVIADAQPVVGGRVLVPFGQGQGKTLSGIVTRLHDEKPPAKVIKRIAQVIDSEPVIDEKLIALGRWIAGYYMAPIGEVLQTMLPLRAEFRQQFGYVISELGTEELLRAPRANDEKAQLERAFL